MRDVEINAEPVELYKLLKFSGLIDSGGAAKLCIDNGDVLVNGVVERRKRKKIMVNDIVEFEGDAIRAVMQVS